jgi:hypothetical protein
MVLGEGEKPSGEEVSVRLLLLALLEDQGQTNNNTILSPYGHSAKYLAVVPYYTLVTL